jgi:hypothetical protein
VQSLLLLLLLQVRAPISKDVRACAKMIRELYTVEGFTEHFYTAVDPVQLRNPLRASVLDQPQNLGMVLYKVRFMTKLIIIRC